MYTENKMKLAKYHAYLVAMLCEMQKIWRMTTSYINLRRLNQFNLTKEQYIMGDRAQIAVKQESGTVYLYTHWSGHRIYKDLAKALRAGEGRWNDEEYLTRIIFCTMLAGDTGTTGYGISLALHGDNEYPVPIVNCNTASITLDMPNNPYKVSFHEWIEIYGEVDHHNNEGKAVYACFKKIYGGGMKPAI